MDRPSPSQRDVHELPKIILFGDSLTAWSFRTSTGNGLGDVLSRHYEGRADVKNEGWPGGTTESLSRQFTRIISDVLKKAHTSPSPILFTIFLGANDACLFPPVVPLEQFTANFRSFVDTILVEPSMQDTKILLITPPPINVHEATPVEEDETEIGNKDAAASAKKFEADCRSGEGFRTWESKKIYAERVVQIAREYQEVIGEDTVGVLDFWRALTNYGLDREGRECVPEGPLDVAENGRWPGSGLPGARAFGRGVFTDGLHLGELGDGVLSNAVMNFLRQKWPEIL